LTCSGRSDRIAARCQGSSACDTAPSAAGSENRLSVTCAPVPAPRTMRDVLAGFTLAAMNVPQVLGYTKIAGMPVVTGLYTLLLPLVAFAALGSSRYLVVAADSATAAILAGGLSPMAPAAGPHYVALGSAGGGGGATGRRLFAVGAPHEARLHRRLSLADRAHRISDRRWHPGWHRGARRDAGRAGRHSQDARATRPGRRQSTASPCLDHLHIGGGRGSGARLRPIRRIFPGRSSPSWARWRRAPRSTSLGMGSM